MFGPGLDLAFDLPELLDVVELEDDKGERLCPVLRRRAVFHRCLACHVEILGVGLRGLGFRCSLLDIQACLPPPRFDGVFRRKSAAAAVMTEPPGNAGSIPITGSTLPGR